MFALSVKNVLWHASELNLWHLFSFVAKWSNFCFYVRKIDFQKTCALEKSIYVVWLEEVRKINVFFLCLCYWYCESSVSLGVWPTRKFPTLKSGDPARTDFVSIIPWFIVENNEKQAANHSVVRDQIASKKDMAFTEEKFSKQLAISKLKLEEIMELPTSGYMEDISLA